MYIHVPSALIVLGIVALFVGLDFYDRWDDARRVKRGELSDR
ncbi:hypothetical protein [Stenotrophomonas phage RAS14]